MNKQGFFIISLSKVDILRVRTSVDGPRDPPRSQCRQDERRSPTMPVQSLTDLMLEADATHPEFLLDRLALLLARKIVATSPTERQELSVAAIVVFLACVDVGMSDQACDLVEHFRDELVMSEQLVA